MSVRLETSPTSVPFYLSLALAETVAVLEITMTYVALPKMLKVFGSLDTVIWVITANFLVAGSTAALVGRLGDMYGRRRVLIAVLTLACVGTLISIFSTQFIYLVIGRGLEGIGISLVPLSFGLVRERMPSDKVATGIGLLSVVPIAMSVLALPIGGVLVDTFSWRSIFYFSGMVNALALLVVWRVITPSPTTKSLAKVDWLGALMFPPAIAGILYAVSIAKSVGWGNFQVHAVLLACFIVLAIWVRYELHQKCPMIDVRLLANKKIALALFCMVMFALGAIQMTQIVSLLIQQPSWTGIGFEKSATFFGLINLPCVLLALFGGWISARITLIRGSRSAAMLGASLMGIAWVVISLYHSDLFLVMGMFYIATIGYPTLYAALQNMIVEAAPLSRTSEAAGVGAVFRMVFSAVGAQTVGILLATSTIADPINTTVKFPTENSFVSTFWALVGVNIVCLIVAYVIPRSSAAVRSI